MWLAFEATNTTTATTAMIASRHPPPHSQTHNGTRRFGLGSSLPSLAQSTSPIVVSPCGDRARTRITSTNRTLAALLAQFAARHFVAQDARRRKSRADLALEVFGDRRRTSSPTRSVSLSGPHREAVAEHHRLVDVIGGRDARSRTCASPRGRCTRPSRLDAKPGESCTSIGSFGPSGRESANRELRGVVRGQFGAHDLDQLHDVHRVEEVHATDTAPGERTRRR